MPTANWGIDASDIDDFDRTQQFKPYTGPQPPLNQVYNWRIKKLQRIAGTREKKAQLRVGLELEPRNSEEERYKDYFVMDFIPIMDKTVFRYAPLLDALGVSGMDFAKRTKIDEEGNILRIGKWRNDGDEVVAAQIRPDTDQDGAPRVKVSWYGEATETDFDEDDEEDYDEDGEDYDEDDDGF